MPTGGEFEAYGVGAAMADTDPAVQRRQEIRNGMLYPAWHEFRYPRPAIDEPTPGFRRAIEVCVDSAAVREAALLAEKAHEIQQLRTRLGFMEGQYEAARNAADRIDKALEIARNVNRGWADARELSLIRAALEGRDSDA